MSKMRYRNQRSWMAVAAAVALWRGAPAAGAEAASRSARNADQIWADFVGASGGEAPWKKHRSLSADMTLEVRGLGLSGTATSLWTSRKQYLETGEIPNMLVTRRGGDGKRYWSQDPIDGLRWLSGAEAEQMALSASWGGILGSSRMAKSKKIVAPLVPGSECLEFTFAQSPAMTTCFDERTHLPTVESGKKVSPQGETPYTTRASDYRDVGGVMFPFVQETTAGPATFVVTVKTVRWDVPAPAKLFKLPVRK